MNIQKNALGLAGFAAAASLGLSLATATTAQAELVGPGCSGYAAQVPTGPGSVTGMAQDPVAVAASNNPLLTTLTAAVSGQLNPDVNLVDTLNGGRVHRVRANRLGVRQDRPGDDREAEDRRAAADKDPDLPRGPRAGQPARRSSARKRPCEGANVTVSGGGSDLKVNNASVVCGGVQTANATVYMIDTVLMPPAN